MSAVVELKDLLPEAPPQGMSFQVLYDAICNNIRAAGTTNSTMAIFQVIYW